MQRFIIIIPVYNATEYIRRCLLSVINQNYADFKVVVIDDCSDDGTWDVIQDYPVESYQNEKRVGSGLANIIQGIKFAAPGAEDVILTVDGDDRLSDREVLSYLNNIYSGDVWMTYGQYLPLSGKYNNFCKKLSNTRNYRKSGVWQTSHLRTFKYWLWEKIKDKDLRDKKGEYFKVAWDRAFMYPLIEMAGKHCKFIDMVLYFYNDLNPSCDMTMKPEESEEVAMYIINKKEYTEL